MKKFIVAIQLAVGSTLISLVGIGLWFLWAALQKPEKTPQEVLGVSAVCFLAVIAIGKAVVSLDEL